MKTCHKHQSKRPVHLTRDVFAHLVWEGVSLTDWSPRRFFQDLMWTKQWSLSPHTRTRSTHPPTQPHNHPLTHRCGSEVSAVLVLQGGDMQEGGELQVLARLGGREERREAQHLWDRRREEGWYVCVCDGCFCKCVSVCVCEWVRVFPFFCFVCVVV